VLLRYLASALLLVAACDAGLAGGWAFRDPAALVSLLAASPTRDSLLLIRVLAGLLLAHVPFLVLAGLRPQRYGGLVLGPLLGRVLLVGLWGWLLATDRVHLARTPLGWLLAHDAGCVLGLVLAAWLARGARSPDRPEQ
jgi:hypothetical protein